MYLLSTNGKLCINISSPKDLLRTLLRTITSRAFDGAKYWCLFEKSNWKSYTGLSVCVCVNQQARSTNPQSRAVLDGRLREYGTRCSVSAREGLVSCYLGEWVDITLMEKVLPCMDYHMRQAVHTLRKKIREDHGRSQSPPASLSHYPSMPRSAHLGLLL